MNKTGFYFLLGGVALSSVMIAWLALLGSQNFQKQNPIVAITSEPQTKEVAAATTNVPNAPDVAEIAPQELPDKELQSLLLHPQAEKLLKLTNRKISKSTLELISKTPWVRNLNLSKCQISNESMGELGKLDLVNLQLNESNFNDTGAANLARCHKLQDLNVKFTAISDVGLKNLKQIKGLQRLTLSYTHITDHGLNNLVECSELGYLDLEGNDAITDKCTGALNKMNLWWLNLSSTSFNDTGLKSLSNTDSLRHINLSGTKVTLKGLREFCLRNPKLLDVYVSLESGLKDNNIKLLRREFPTTKFTVQNDAIKNAFLRS